MFHWKSLDHKLESTHPLILVFYLDRSIFSNREMVATYGENVRKYLENKGDDVRLFFFTYRR